MRPCDAVVPGELVFVEKTPCITQAKRNRRKDRCENAPAPEAARRRSAIEALDFEFGQAQSGGGVREYEKCILVCRPKQGQQGCTNLGRRLPARQRARDSNKNVAKQRYRYRQEQSVNDPGPYPAAKRGRP